MLPGKLTSKYQNLSSHNEIVARCHLANAINLVLQPEIDKKSIKTPFLHLRSSKVIEFGGNQEPVYNFLLVINSNLSPISH